MKLEDEAALEALDSRKRVKINASDEESVCERGGFAVEEGKRVTDDCWPPDGTQSGVVDAEKGEGEGSVKMEPPDGGWGWVVTIASAAIMALVAVMSLCFSVLFSRYFLLSGVSSTTTAWIFNTQTFFYNTSALFVRPLSQEFGWRKIGVVGAFLASFGFAITAFTPSPWFLFFSFSIVSGIGGGIVTTLCFVVVPTYFTKRRGISNAVLGCGSGIGQIAIPPLLTVLQDTFGDRGATLMFSGLMLHSCIAATTFHPVERHMKPSSVRSTEEGSEVAKPQPNSHTDNSASSHKPSIFVRVAKSTVSDLAILRSRRALIITMAWSFAICSTLNFLMIVPFALQDAGFSLDFSAWCLSSLGMSSFIARTLTSALTDLRFFKVRVFFVVGLVIMTATNAVFPVVDSQGWYLAILVGYGVGLGTIAGLNTLVMIDVMGLDRLAPLFGTTCFLSALTLVTLGPILGVIRDVSGSYPVSIWSAAGMVGFSVLLWAMMGRATKWDTERSEEGRPYL